MQRFVNNPDYIVEDMVKGFLKAHDDLIVKNEKMTALSNIKMLR